MRWKYACCTNFVCIKEQLKAVNPLAKGSILDNWECSEYLSDSNN